MTFSFASNTIGDPNVGIYPTIAPGTGNLPSVVLEAQLGEIRTAWDSTLGYAEFIYLKIPVTTAIPLGSLVTWNAIGGAATPYSAVVLPAFSSSKQTGLPIAVPYVAVASNAAVQYGWFQIQGLTTVLKTAVQVLPAGAPISVSATAGRVRVIVSTGSTILGAFFANTATVTSTTSTVLVYLNRSCVMGL